MLPARGCRDRTAGRVTRVQTLPRDSRPSLDANLRERRQSGCTGASTYEHPTHEYVEHAASGSAVCSHPRRLRCPVCTRGTPSATTSPVSARRDGKTPRGRVQTVPRGPRPSPDTTLRERCWSVRTRASRERNLTHEYVEHVGSRCTRTRRYLASPPSAQSRLHAPSATSAPVRARSRYSPRESQYGMGACRRGRQGGWMCPGAPRRRHLLCGAGGVHVDGAAAGGRWTDTRGCCVASRRVQRGRDRRTRRAEGGGQRGDGC